MMSDLIPKDESEMKMVPGTILPDLDENQEDQNSSEAAMNPEEGQPGKVACLRAAYLGALPGFMK